ncbi:hypothetical protein BBD41_23695 [Paenibacillus ihbetae]|uniref:Uncharacterized protein n=1 Tax=Paenibacillus ihbetae TaxID=1870820 RepID=A0A1B2E5T3_9BACL|nr:hypothetical protein [Paenibacillus ihbetae]ANY75335.1 hypothetical protein BBD41_23695 [Paenibacillus ihbetae]
MHNRTLGAVFIGISVVLFGIRNLTAAIITINSQVYIHFDEALQDVGKAPVILSIISLAIGLFHVYGPIFVQWFKKDLDRIESNWKEFDEPHTEGRNP